ncbi:MAG: amino acid permease [Acidobacteria bacterium]|nr:amino acid permease [Acidobacteriota bacterium]
MTEHKQTLKRALTLTDCVSVVVGTVIGTGVFLKSALMAQQLGTPALVLLAWLAAGLLSLAGALTYAELGAMFPRAGGEYVYLGKAYGDGAAFLYGWMQVAVAATGGIAAIATGFAIFLSALVPLGGAWVERTFRLFGQEVHWQLGMTQVVAIAAIVLFSAINCVGVRLGGRVQSALTGAKVLGIAVIVFGAFLLSRGAGWSNLSTPAGTPRWSGAQSFGAAMLAALWAYNGWYCLPLVAGEVERPQRNVPRGLIAGMLVVLAVYLLTNLSYFYALPFGEVLTANSTAHPDAPPVAAKAALTFLGPVGAGFVAVAFIVSTVGALNGAILALSRIPYAMARDGLFFKPLGDVSERSRVPARAIIFQGAWASVLALSGTFDQISTYTIFALWLFFGVTATSVFVLRRKMPDAERPYRTLGYPVVPLLFVLVAAWLVVNTILTSPVESAVGLLLIALGLPVYFYFKHGRRRGAH